MFVQRGAHVVVGRERVATGDGDFRATFRERLHENCRLRFDVHRHADSLAGQRFVGDELLLNRRHYRHVLARPVHLAVPLDASGLQVVQLLAYRRVVCHTCEMDERVENGTEGNQRSLVVRWGVTRRSGVGMIAVIFLPPFVPVTVALCLSVIPVVVVSVVCRFVFLRVTVGVADVIPVLFVLSVFLRVVGFMPCTGVVGSHPRGDDSAGVFDVLAREQLLDERVTC